jgi:hypothetical protein
MDKREFFHSLRDLLLRTLVEGPGPRAVAQITADALARYIMNEAGPMAPDAVEEMVSRLRGHIETATAAMMGDA